MALNLHQLLDGKVWNSESIKAFLENDASTVNKIDLRYKQQPLIRVLESEKCSIEIVRLLLEFGAEVNATDPLHSPLSVALRWNKGYDVIKALLDKGADATNWRSYGRTMLCYALRCKATSDVVELLVDAGGNPNTCTRHVSVLECASIYSMAPQARRDLSVGVFETLAEVGADLSKFGRNGESPMCFAFRSGVRPNEIKFLTKEGLTLDSCRRHASVWACAVHGYASTHYFTIKKTVGETEFVEQLLQSRTGSPIETLPRLSIIKGSGFLISYTPTHLILEFCQYEANAIQVLVDYPGVNVNVRTNSQDTLLHCTMKNILFCDPSVVKLLIQKGARLNAENENNQTPLHLAAGKESRTWGPDVKSSVLKILLDNCSNLKAEDERGVTPLNLAVTLAQDPDTVRQLLRAGAQTKDRTKDLLELALEQYLANECNTTLDCLKLLLTYRFLEDPGFEMANFLERLKKVISLELKYLGKECAKEVKVLHNIKVGETKMMIDFIRDRSAPKMVAASKKRTVLNDCFSSILEAMNVDPCKIYLENIADVIGKSSMIIRLQEIRMCAVKYMGSNAEEKVYLPYDCVREISKYLIKVEDLLRLIVAFGSPDSQTRRRYKVRCDTLKSEQLLKRSKLN